MMLDNSSPFGSLKTISLRDLRRCSAEESDKLFAAAKDDGIFYLDLTEDVGKNRLADLVGGIYGLSRSLFDLDIDEKMQYDVDQIGELKLNGYVLDSSLLCPALLTPDRYKPISRNIGGIEGQRDGFESYSVRLSFSLKFHRSNSIDPTQWNPWLRSFSASSCARRPPTSSS